ncbi:MAG: 16S rRNA (cytidine(1402)-2'-O)-methyltransferase [Clostridiaceae bacterium]|nr:16S rRNA (cytidine(1402)-2'-O)-methyltransferase [Clostridiaceae bacterium]
MQPGVLYLVGTPIGNLGDLSPRAAGVLAEADWIAAEDTRHTLKLLNHLGLKKHLVSYHKFNAREREDLLLDKLRQGGKLALVSDAGMPGISDPGADLVIACAAAGIPVTVIPGPSAVIVALAGSGLLTDRFAFEGFLPQPAKVRKARILEIAAERRTLVLYEAPHRLVRTLRDLEQGGLAGRRITVAKELTKRYEAYLRTTVAQACQELADQKIRGEYALVIEGLDAYAARCPQPAAAPEAENNQDLARIQALLQQGVSLKDAVRQQAKTSPLSRNELYRMALGAMSCYNGGCTCPPEPEAGEGSQTRRKQP